MRASISAILCCKISFRDCCGNLGESEEQQIFEIEGGAAPWRRCCDVVLHRLTLDLFKTLFNFERITKKDNFHLKIECPNLSCHTIIFLL
jgi:hypothetical protein